MRLVIVSNRLPLTAVEKGLDFELRPSVGGLATGIHSYLEWRSRAESRASDHLWIGWPGVRDFAKKSRLERLFARRKAFPVFLLQKTLDGFYNGFCNRTLWPLFHFFPGYTVFEEGHWEDFHEANRVYAEAVVRKARPGDVLWIHDYHLLLLPRLIREQLPQLPIGFFLHIPFPSFEIFRLLPAKWRREILEGLLGADLIGFHTHDYTQAFLRCVLRILGHEHHNGILEIEGRVVKADTFPMGIDYEGFRAAAASPKIVAEGANIKRALRNAKLILSVDRLDYTKGILNRLEGYELFLEKNPSWQKKVRLFLVLVPSRTQMNLYQDMKRKIDEAIGRINGRFGSHEWTPVLYQYRAKTTAALTSLYTAADVALVTPLRDGMNLIAKEYVASRREGTGVLILSEMAGAVYELGEAAVVNPNSREEIAQAIHAGLEMPVEEQVRRNRAMQRRLERYTVVRWADDFLQQLAAVRRRGRRRGPKVLSGDAARRLLSAFRAAKRRALLLDYDGTLTPYFKDPAEAKPARRLTDLLRCLTALPRCRTVLISGRPRAVLEEWFGDIPVALVAEHGAWLRGPKGPWRRIRPLRDPWREEIRALLQTYADRLPGAFVEEKEYGLVWHFRNSPPEMASLREKELLDELLQRTGNLEVQVLRGNKIVEVRAQGVTKAEGAFAFLGRRPPDFLMAVGDDATDEDLFRALPARAHTLRVGKPPTAAKFTVPNHRAVLRLLRSLAR